MALEGEPLDRYHTIRHYGTRPTRTVDLEALATAYRSGESLKRLSVDNGMDIGTLKKLLAPRVQFRSMSEAITLGSNKRGRPKPLQEKLNSALTRERIGRMTADERALEALLRLAGIPTIPQKAIGPYNVDLAAEPVAVEIFGGGWHGHGWHREQGPDRARYILDAGWHLVVIWTHQTYYPLSPDAAEYVRAFVQEARRDPSLPRQYRVIRGSGEHMATGSTDFDEITRVPARKRRPRKGS